MNKIGRTRTRRQVVELRATRQFLRQADDAEAYVKATLADQMGRRRDGRWLAWRPLGDAEMMYYEGMDDFVMNTATISLQQPWEWRFIGRRR